MAGITDLGDPQAFFAQLQTFSQRALASLRLPVEGSPWGGTTPFSVGAPVGAVLHYTASESMLGTLRWFCDPKLNPGGQESAHFLVGAERYAWGDAFLGDLPLVQALPVTVVMCRPLNVRANHATWLNGTTFGIENVNLGLTTQSACPQALCVGKRTWAPYPLAQLQTNVALLRALRALPTSRFVPEYVLAHEHVETLSTVGYAQDKRDPGPLFPTAEVRDAAFGAAGTTGVLGGQVSASAAAQARILSAPAASSKPAYSAKSLPFNAYARRLLQALGYAVCPEGQWQQGASVRIAQRALGQATDGVLGPMSVAALEARVRDCFGL